MTIRKFEKKDVAEMVRIWNQVVEEGVAFPQEDDLRHYVHKVYWLM